MNLYFIVSGEFVKVGLANDVDRRLEGLRVGNPHPMTVAAWRTIPAALARPIEKGVHLALVDHAHFGEWFRVDAATAVRAAKPVVDKAWRQFRSLKAADMGERTGALARALAERDMETLEPMGTYGV